MSKDFQMIIVRFLEEKGYKLLGVDKEDCAVMMTPQDVASQYIRIDEQGKKYYADTRPELVLDLNETSQEYEERLEAMTPEEVHEELLKFMTEEQIQASVKKVEEIFKILKMASAD